MARSSRTLFLALLFAITTIGATATFATSYFPGETDFNGSTFQTNALTGDPTGLTVTGVTDSDVVNLAWTDAATTNFGTGDVQMAQWTNAAHTCPTTATSYTFESASAWAASLAHAPTDTLDPAAAGGKPPAGGYVCYAASIAYGQGAPGAWTSSTPLWYGFAPTHTTNAARYGEYVAGITMSGLGTIKKNTNIAVLYSQNTNQAAALGGLGVCLHHDTASGMTLVFFGYSGATCSYTPATAATAQTQYGYVVQTAGTTGAFSPDETSSLGVTWNAPNILTLTLSTNLSGGTISESGTTWAYHVSATAPAGATQVKSLGSGSLVAENAYCPVATSSAGF